MVHSVVAANDLEQSAIDYATSLRMGHGVSQAAATTLYESLKTVRDQLSDAAELDRGLATLLMELVVTSWGSTTQYSEDARREIVGSVALISEAVMAVLTPDEMPPAPRS
jgi:hypothetical protein